MTHNVFHEPIPNHIAHTAFSALIATDPDFNSWVAFQHRINVPISWKLVEAVEKWGESSETSKTAYNIALETELPWFEYLAQPENEEISKIFSGCMRGVNKSELMSVKNLLKGFDWASLPRGSRVIDVCFFLIPHFHRMSTGADSSNIFSGRWLHWTHQYYPSRGISNDQIYSPGPSQRDRHRSCSPCLSFPS